MSDIVDVSGHTLVISADGATSPGHPETDIADCGFDEHVAAEWFKPQSFYRPSRLVFTRLTNTTTGQTYWNWSKTG